VTVAEYGDGRKSDSDDHHVCSPLPLKQLAESRTVFPGPPGLTGVAVYKLFQPISPTPIVVLSQT
jgi:hypothetical protein